MRFWSAVSKAGRSISGFHFSSSFAGNLVCGPPSVIWFSTVQWTCSFWLGFWCLGIMASNWDTEHGPDAIATSGASVCEILHAEPLDCSTPLLICSRRIRACQPWWDFPQCCVYYWLQNVALIESAPSLIIVASLISQIWASSTL